MQKIKYMLIFMMLLLVSIINTSALASDKSDLSTGNAFYYNCPDSKSIHNYEDKAALDYCLGYINGIHDQYVWNTFIDSSINRYNCIANKFSGVTLGQEFDILLSYLNRHPESRNIRTTFLWVKSVSEAFHLDECFRKTTSSVKL